MHANQREKDAFKEVLGKANQCIGDAAQSRVHALNLNQRSKPDPLATRSIFRLSRKALTTRDSGNRFGLQFVNIVLTIHLTIRQSEILWFKSEHLRGRK